MNYKLKRRVSHTRAENLKNRDIYRILKRAEKSITTTNQYIGMFGKEVIGGNLSNGLNTDDIKYLYLKTKQKALTIEERNEIKNLSKRVSGINLERDISENVIKEYLDNIYGSNNSREKMDARRKLSTLSVEDRKRFFKTKAGSLRYNAPIIISGGYLRYLEKSYTDWINQGLDDFMVNNGYVRNVGDNE